MLPSGSLFVKSDFWILGAFTAGTVAMFPLDRRIAGRIRDSALVNDASLERAARVVGFMGSPGPFLIGGAMYAAGRLAGKPRLTHLAVHGGEAIVVGVSAAAVLKMMLGRARPLATPDTNPGDFGFARGFSADRYQAFPSGHATTAFAAASAVTLELQQWYPGSAWIVGPVLYGGAALVGASRMYENKHWASDVVLGAAIGTFAGLKTVRFTHTRTGNRVDRWLMGGDQAQVQIRVLPSGDGGLRLTLLSRW
jgi:membrane-associated phospholipid phosphatase